MASRICEKLGSEFPFFAFSHCRGVIAAAQRTSDLLDAKPTEA